MASGPSPQQRSDSEFAREVVATVFEGTPGSARGSYRKFLTASVDYLSQHHPDRWGVTLLGRGVRLNAGWVECLVLHHGGLRILVEKKSAPPGTKFDGRSYRWARGCRMTTLPLSELHRAPPQLADSHHKALSIAAKRQPPPNIRGAHSPGLTKLWSLPDPTPGIAERVRALVSQRRETGIVIDESDIAAATIDELRKAALVRASKSATKKERARVYRIASRLIRSYVLRRAKGHCEACTRAAPFRSPDGSPYLEAHHTKRLADDGPDHPAKVIGLCPNCHRRAHLSEDAESFNASLVRKLPKLERASKNT